MKHAWSQRLGGGRVVAAATTVLFGILGCGESRRKPEGSAPPRATAAIFTDATRESGIDFVHDNGSFGEKYYPERMGSGAALFDANGDGFLDLFLVNGAPLPGHPQPSPKPSRLYLGDGAGRFRNATVGSGLERPGYGMGVAAADIDNDGDTDLYVTRLGGNSLYLNDGKGRFKEIAGAGGAIGGGFCTSSAWVDIDADGLLDLYVCRYVPWNSPKDDYRCTNPEGEKAYCSVHVYPGLEHRLYRSAGVRGGAPRFEDITRKAGIAGHIARGLAIVAGDYDQDGDQDLFVADDETPNFLWNNPGKGRFEDRGVLAGFALNEEGRATAGMGLDLADVDGNGWDDVIESDFHGQRKTLYVADGSGLFTPNAGNKGLGEMPINRLGFGIGFLDFDLDGWLDVFIANGHVNDDMEKAVPPVPYKQTAQLFRNSGGGMFTDATAQLGSYGATPHLGRGTAFGDIDNDGDVDLVVANNGEEPVLLRNDRPAGNHWIGVRFIGKESNRLGIGARVILEAGGRSQTREARTSYSYLSSCDPRLVFGLGGEATVGKLTVVWPSGTRQSFESVRADRYIEITEGQSLPN